MEPILYILIGLAIGTALGYLLRSLRPTPPDKTIEDGLRQQLATLDSELSRLRQDLMSANEARAAAEATKSAGDIALNEERDRHRQTEEKAGRSDEALKDDLSKLQKRVSVQDVDLRVLQERLDTQRSLVESLQEKFLNQFKTISNNLLLDSSKSFNAQSSASLGQLLGPLEKTLGEFKTSLETTRKETATHSALLKDQINRIGDEAANLSKALKGDVKTLGNWGENMLDQILEKSGLQRDVHYRRQQGTKDAEGDQRFLDVIVELPEKRNLVIDSKVSLRSYEEFINCGDDAARGSCLERHVEALRSHFRGLGAKRYQDLQGIGSPDFVLMYLPIEAAFFAAIAHEPALFSEALEHNVVLITNSTLLATLRTVAHVWRLVDQQKHALEIAERGGKLYDKFVGFVEDLNEVGRALKNGHEAWEAASNKLHTGQGNLVRQAEQLKILGAKAAKALPPALIEKAADSDASVPPSPTPTT